MKNNYQQLLFAHALTKHKQIKFKNAKQRNREANIITAIIMFFLLISAFLSL